MTRRGDKKVADKLSAFEGKYGHLVETGLRAMIAELERGAVVADGHYRADMSAVIRDQATDYREALKAWLELMDALSEWCEGK